MNAPRDVVSAVLADPNYQLLVQKRTRISYIFFAITLVIYAGFILTLAFDPELFAEPVGNMTMSIGVLCALLVAVSAVILIFAYVYISNRVFDPLLAKVEKDVL